MTRKHFEALAAALANIRPKPERESMWGPPVKGLGEGRNAWQNSVDLIANVCAESNPRFDRDKFLAATLEG